MDIRAADQRNGLNGSRVPRIESIDCLRGLIMAFMALDHARGYAFAGSFDFLDLKRTTLFLFFMRWMANFGAPLFVFLAGASAFLYMHRGKTKAQLSEYLLVRGLILVTLEIAYFSRVLTLSSTEVLLQVIWVLGLSMILLSLLVWLPDRMILAYGVVMVFGHNLLDGVAVDPASPWYLAWSILHQASREVSLSPTLHVRVVYPLVPWTGVMALGYLFGKLFTLEKERRTRIILLLGAGTIAAFIVLRMLNVYGDPHPWHVRRNFVRTLLTFLNCCKYPPSLSFLLMTLGPGLCLLAALERKLPRVGEPFIMFGRVPLFYYIVHFPVLLLVMAAAGAVLKGVPIGGMTMDALKGDIGYVYFIWIAGLVVLYPICRWYCGKKSVKTWGWMKYF